MRRLALLLVAVAVVVVPSARADGDPASDYLLGQQTFVPPDAGFSSLDKQRLDALLTGARRGGYTLRVAIIASRNDLGAVTALDRKPGLYAHFLSQELRFFYKKRVLVVMANGYGIARNGEPAPAEQAVVNRLPPVGAARGGVLAAAAERAVRALTAHAGVRIVSVPLGTKGSPPDRSGWNSFLIALGVVAFVLLVGAVPYLRKRVTS